jgi:hypothetical protein
MSSSEIIVTFFLSNYISNHSNCKGNSCGFTYQTELFGGMSLFLFEYYFL